MRYGYRHNIDMGGVNNYGKGLLIDMRDQFGSIPGWEVFDDKTSNPAGTTCYVVWKVTTSEGVGNEVYVKVNCQQTDCFGIETWEGWNSATSTGTGDVIGMARHEHNNNYKQMISWRYAGDQDHVVFAVDGESMYAPTYLGLTTKLRPNSDGPRGWIMCSWYYIGSSHSTVDQDGLSYSDDTKCPVLRGQDGTHNKRSRVFRTSPNFDEVSISGGPRGPFSASQIPGKRRAAVYFYPLVLVEGATHGETGTGFGPRGILKSVLIDTDSYYSGYGKMQPMKIGSRDYMIYRTTRGANDTYSRRNSWGQYYGSGEWEMSWAIPTSDWYVPCYIEGAE